MVRAAALIFVAVIATLSCSGCGPGPAGPIPDSTQPAQAAGAIIATENQPAVDETLQLATAWARRVTYISQSGINGAPTRVTGAVFVPKGNPPQGGWRVVAFAHPTTGTLAGCAPSLSPTLLNALAIVAALLNAGYVVSMTDYQGLGNIANDGDANAYHPYLDSTTAGYNVIDSVRAARAIVPQASRDWAALGVGQGGQAVWAANELADNYASGLKLVGTASISPFADITGLADAAEAGELTTDQELVLQAFLAALKNEYGDDFNLEQYRRGIVRDKWDVLLACQVPLSTEREQAANQIRPDDLRPDNSGALAVLRSYFQKTNLPQGPAQAPMLVIYGGKDSLIPPAWTDLALDHACKMGDVIQIQLLPDAGHDQIDPATALGWIGERFNLVAASNDCAAFSAATG